MIPNRLCSSYFSVTVLCSLSYTIKRIVAHRRASRAIHGRIPCPWQNAQKILTVHIPCKTHRYTHKKEAVRNIIYLWQHDETAVPDSAASTAPLINSCFKSQLLLHLSTSSFQRYLIIGMPLCVCQALFYKKILSPRQNFRTQNLLILNIVSPYFCHKMTPCPIGRYLHLHKCFPSYSNLHSNGFTYRAFFIRKLQDRFACTNTAKGGCCLWLTATNGNIS